MPDTLSGITTIGGTPGECRVTVIDVGTIAVVDTMLSDASTGEWEFTGLPSGMYEILFVKDGYMPIMHGPWQLDGVP